MKYYFFLLANCLLVLFITMFFIDNKFIPESNAGRVRNVILLLLLITVSYNLVSIYLLKRSAPESGVVYKIVTGAKTAFTGFGNYIQPFKKELIIYSLVALGLIIVGVILVGMPGYFFLNIPVKLGICTAITGDAAWPAAILLSILWPLCLPLGVFAKQWLAAHGYGSVSMAAPALTLVAGIPFFTAITYALSK